MNMQGQNRCVDGEILWFDGCPAHERAKALVLDGARQGLADVSNRRTEVPDERGRTPGLLSRVSTVRIAGFDVEAGWLHWEDSTPRCRIYPTSSAVQGLPERQWLRPALSMAAARLAGY